MKAGRWLDWLGPRRLAYVNQGAPPAASPSRDHQMRRLARLEGVLGGLAEARVPVMLLKGAALMVAGLLPLGQRPLGDIDLLVPRQHFLEALRVLEGLGWRSRDRASLDFAWGEHALTLFHPVQGQIDLHWSSLNEGRQWAGCDEGLWSRANPSQWLGQPVWLPGLSDLFWHCLLHGYRRGGSSSHWRHDAGVLLQQGLDWNVILEEGRRRQLELPLLSCLQLLGEVGPPVQSLRQRPIPWWQAGDAWLRSQAPPGSLPKRLLLPLFDFLRQRSLGGTSNPLRYLWRTYRLGLRLPRLARTLVTLEAFLLMLVSLVLVYLLPFRFLARWLGPDLPVVGVTPDNFERARVVASRISWLSARLPGSWSCLVQATAGHLMLRRRGIACTLFLGAGRKESGLHAHAWLQCGPQVILGAQGIPEVRQLRGFTWSP